MRYAFSRLGVSVSSADAIFSLFPQEPVVHALSLASHDPPLTPLRQFGVSLIPVYDHQLGNFAQLQGH